jgi:YesN/AraC family two-component response regulator
MSEYYFCRFFKKVTFMTFVEYINKLRINIAIKFLLDTNMTIAQISDAVGFNDPSYFNRVFKKLNGNSPLTFRNNTLENQLKD